MRPSLNAWVVGENLEMRIAGGAASLIGTTGIARRCAVPDIECSMAPTRAKKASDGVSSRPTHRAPMARSGTRRVASGVGPLRRSTFTRLDLTLLGARSLGRSAAFRWIRPLYRGGRRNEARRGGLPRAAWRSWRAHHMQTTGGPGHGWIAVICRTAQQEPATHAAARQPVSPPTWTWPTTRRRRCAALPPRSRRCSSRIGADRRHQFAAGVEPLHALQAELIKARPVPPALLGFLVGLPSSLACSTAGYRQAE